MQPLETDVAGSKSKMLLRLVCSWHYEDCAREAYGATATAGIDEAGRGCLAVSCFAAAVVLDRSIVIADGGIRDSKMLAAKKRERIAQEIRDDAVCYAVASVDAITIDRINIAEAAKLAMARAIAALDPQPDFLLVDGFKLDHSLPQFVITHGDGVSFSIAAASILAKVAKNAEMLEMASLYPGYGFEKNMSYGTKDHLEALRNLGPCPIHRKTFHPVAQAVLPWRSGHDNSATLQNDLIAIGRSF